MERYDSYGHTAVQPYRPRLGRSANLRLDTRRRKGIRNWYIFATDKISLRDQFTNILSADNRWHIKCFRCKTCSAILDSDSDLFLLADWSLICKKCTYSCSVCNVRIENLAIITGDQAFCETCFKCRNCQTKIEDSRYARTSQGIFCMECRESLMLRRRMKALIKGLVPKGKELPALPSEPRHQILGAVFLASDTMANSSMDSSYW